MGYPLFSHRSASIPHRVSWQVLLLVVRKLERFVTHVGLQSCRLQQKKEPGTYHPTAFVFDAQGPGVNLLPYVFPENATDFIYQFPHRSFQSILVVVIVAYLLYFTALALDWKCEMAWVLSLHIKNNFDGRGRPFLLKLVRIRNCSGLTQTDSWLFK